MDRHNAKHSSRIPGPVPSSHYQHFTRRPLPSQPVHWSCPPELEKPGSPPRLICKARSVSVGKGGNGGRERGEQKQQPNRKEKEKKKVEGKEKNSEAGLFLSSPPSIQCQQGRSTTVASHGAQKNLTSVF